MPAVCVGSSPCLEAPAALARIQTRVVPATPMTTSMMPLAIAKPSTPTAESPPGSAASSWSSCSSCSSSYSYSATTDRELAARLWRLSRPMEDHELWALCSTSSSSGGSSTSSKHNNNNTHSNNNTHTHNNAANGPSLPGSVPSSPHSEAATTTTSTLPPSPTASEMKRSSYTHQHQQLHHAAMITRTVSAPAAVSGKRLGGMSTTPMTSLAACQGSALYKPMRMRSRRGIFSIRRWWRAL